MEIYFEPFKFSNGVELRNRMMMAPMTTYSANRDDTVSDAEIAYYEARSNGVGAVITACTYVIPSGKAFHGQFASYSDEYIDSLRRVAQAIHKGGAKAILQIHHGGHQSFKELVPNGDVVSASVVDTIEGEKARELTLDEIKEIIHAFGEATRRAIEAGFDGVEIHGANHYLFQQFFSGHTNKRTDHYGGSIEKRMNFPLEVVAEVNKIRDQYANDSFIIGYRFSPEEREDDGITMDETIQLVDRLAEERIDYLHMSLLNFRSFSRKYEGEKDNRIKIIRRALNGRVPLVAAGKVQTREDIVEASETGAELLAAGRALLMEPNWYEKVSAGEDVRTEMDMTRDNIMPDSMMETIKATPGWVDGVE